MARPMTSQAIADTKAAEKRAETAEQVAHMVQAAQYTPTDKEPIEPPLPSLDPTAGQA